MMCLNLFNRTIELIKGSSRWKKASKCKSTIKKLKIRLENSKSRNVAIIRQSRADIAEMLRNGQHTDALARVERFHDDLRKASAYDRIEVFCDVISDNLHDISRQSVEKLSFEVVEAVSSLIFAASRCGELPELGYIKYLFRQRLGQMFEETTGNSVDSLLIHHLQTASATEEVKLKLLQEIGKEYGLDFISSDVQETIIPEINMERVEYSKTDENLNKIGKNQIQENYTTLYNNKRTSQMKNHERHILNGTVYNQEPNIGFNSGCKRGMKKNTTIQHSSKFKSKDGFARDGSLASDRSIRGRDQGCNEHDKGLLRSPHVHPKLPDYDELVNRFTKIKQRQLRHNLNHGTWKETGIVEFAHC